MNHSTNPATGAHPATRPPDADAVVTLVGVATPGGIRHAALVPIGRLLVVVAPSVPITAWLVAATVRACVDLPPTVPGGGAPGVPVGAPRARLGDAPGTPGTEYRGEDR